MTGTFKLIVAAKKITLVMLILDLPFIENTVDPDQMTSEEAI